MPVRLHACLAALVVVSSLLAMPVTASAHTGAAAPTGLSWKKCGRNQCSVLQVPVDYTQPDGEQVGIAVIRRPATDQQHKLGSLLVNFGGPGEAGTTTFPSFVGQLPAEVRARYDLVSFDPRGVGASRPIRCVDDKTHDALDAADPTPNSDAELPSYYDGTHYPVDLVAACVAKNGTWLADVGSRDVARDMDRLRAALGDPKLNYLGYSYGTVIGAVYAQMFPTRVGHLVLDSAVNLSDNALDEQRSDVAGFEHALDAFLADCAARTKCDFHSGGDPASALRTLQGRFEAGLTLPTADAHGRRSTREAGVSAFYTALISALYDKQFGWPTLAQGLHFAEQGDGTLLLALADSYDGRHDDGTYDNIDEAIGEITCDDREDPVPSFADYVAEYHREAAAYPFLGAFIGSTVLGCDPRLPRPPASEQLGDVRATGTAPILVVGTTDDPATSYAGAQDLQQRLAGSRLLTFVSTEHTAYGGKSACIDRAVDGYLLRSALPRVGTRCH